MLHHLRLAGSRADGYRNGVSLMSEKGEVDGVLPPPRLLERRLLPPGAPAAALNALPASLLPWTGFGGGTCVWQRQIERLSAGAISAKVDPCTSSRYRRASYGRSHVVSRTDLVEPRQQELGVSRTIRKAC